MTTPARSPTHPIAASIPASSEDDDLNIEIEYVAPDLQRELSIASTTDSTFSQQSIEEFKQIFEKFEKLNNKTSELSVVTLADVAANKPYDPLAVTDAGENKTGKSYCSRVFTHSITHFFT